MVDPRMFRPDSLAGIYGAAQRATKDDLAISGAQAERGAQVGKYGSLNEYYGNSLDWQDKGREMKVFDSLGGEKTQQGIAYWNRSPLKKWFGEMTPSPEEQKLLGQVVVGEGGRPEYPLTEGGRITGGVPAYVPPGKAVLPEYVYKGREVDESGKHTPGQTHLWYHEKGTDPKDARYWGQKGSTYKSPKGGGAGGGKISAAQDKALTGEIMRLLRTKYAGLFPSYDKDISGKVTAPALFNALGKKDRDTWNDVMRRAEAAIRSGDVGPSTAVQNALEEVLKERKAAVDEYADPANLPHTVTTTPAERYVTGIVAPDAKPYGE